MPPTVGNQGTGPAHGVLIVVGQTGCGKTTQLPQYLFETGWAGDSKVIACTQPRRVAATSVAMRVAEEVGCVLGEEVGYTIRFEDMSDPEKTRIKIRRKRPSLRLIISSATLDAQYFYDYFTSMPGDTPSTTAQPDEAVIISLEGRMYPVEVGYLREPVSDYVREAAETVKRVHVREGAGDVLVFLTGREEIDRCLDMIGEWIPTMPDSALRLTPLPLHAGLPFEEQQRIFDSPLPGTRKVIISTNIAEASVTIDGIRFVVDSGFVKLRSYDARSGISRLVTTPVSRASALQRAGRAGRTSKGVCYRLYTEEAYNGLRKTTPPELVRTDLALPVLQLKSLGIDNLNKFEWPTPPPAENLVRALEWLVMCGAIDNEGRMTQEGDRMGEIALDLRMAKCLLASGEFKCGEEMLTIAAVTSVQDLFIIPEGQAGALAELERRKFTAQEGGRSSSSFCRAHALNFRALSRAMSIRAQLKKYFLRWKIPLVSCEGDSARLRKCLIAGYWRNAARIMPDGTWRGVRQDTVLQCHPSSVLFTRRPPSGWVIYHEVEETRTTNIRVLTEIDPDWLLEYGYTLVDKRQR
ncbi:pre-mRNA splicing factor [Dacryopinax primogenitus]|uniref:RNA helicase n=1 Tax=Dacryopinax primogenitus (strain DJM 731) TaxID=1858805 RepID=M5FP47_DACPD|nr:pre-mRNA splicing factor [Dacryopinax primogenitus]EJT98205.1 pre-mRNA splicing factor [Dacryopinax primogenitus]